jgi:hypothetical protein
MEILIAWAVFVFGLTAEDLLARRNRRIHDQELYEYRLARYAGPRRLT